MGRSDLIFMKLFDQVSPIPDWSPKQVPHINVPPLFHYSEESVLKKGNTSVVVMLFLFPVVILLLIIVLVVMYRRQ